MSRKVFLSFLGTGNYSFVNYYFNERNLGTVPSRFVQEVLVKHLVQQISDDLLVKIFTTKESLINWNGDGEDSPDHKGLKQSLEDIHPHCTVSNEMVPSGKSEDEIWQIFATIFNLLEENDEIYLDITHAFRTLPMLNMVLINYAKLLKGITVKKIYYGAFDAREEVEGKTWAPIWNLDSFSKLQNWTNGANLFLKSGNGIFLSELIEDEGPQDIKSLLADFSKEIFVNRGMDIYRGKTAIELKKKLENLEQVETPALKPILNKVKSHFDTYTENSIKNGIIAVKWCIDNGLIQQGATLLEEFVTSWVLLRIGHMEFLQDKDIRSSVSGALSNSKMSEYRYVEVPQLNEEKLKDVGFMALWKRKTALLESEKVIIPKVYGLPNYKKVYRLVNDIKNSIRNDINHAGFRPQARSYDELKSSLSKRYREMLKIIE